ncbi:hypothetical protein SAMN02910369_02726 [Lachnospiraceae bacterium NE2001]|nr:hypothetical protein SAMN02910369_02726 [Lachnospiraceae bacterium NE2001]
MKTDTSNTNTNTPNIRRTVDSWRVITSSENIRSISECRQVLKMVAEMPFEPLVTDDAKEHGWTGPIAQKIINLEKETGRDDRDVIDMVNLYTHFFVNIVSRTRKAARRS